MVDNDNIAGNDPAPRRGAQSIRRAVGVLRILAAGQQDGVALSEVVRVTGLSRPTVHRIIHVLIEEGIVERQGKNYAIGRQVPELALARPSRPALLIASDPILSRASAELGDTLFLTVRTGNDTLCIDRRMGAYPIQVLSIEIGARRPLGVSSAGVAILAALPGQEARKIVSDNERRFDVYRTDAPTILGQIAAARRHGYSLREAGLVHGTKSISVWIKSRNNRPAAALTLTAIKARLGARREQEVAEVLQHSATAIERQLAMLTQSGQARSPRA
ncbi:IclR family transcriptional regulator [Rhodopseudomonas sp. B29]|uniref:IclR family transcriptional regulator n=1 Tax=Rhodopseudomonas sp. B29 TaxID=95607 RepID=UPI0003B2FF18|nr:IclR family transcriptional regulator [Rhodopseudomonas sp. B29]